MTSVITKPKRGRPPKNHDAGADVKKMLIRSGMEMFTEKGYMTSDINGILKKVGVPKGSFYYYFDSKEQFGLEIMRNYDSYFPVCWINVCLISRCRHRKGYGHFI